MTFGPDLSLCPACGYFALRVLESRRSRLARRRRLQCDKCGHRATTHEVDDAFFQQAKENARIVEKFRSLLAVQQTEEEAVSRCHECIHCRLDSCSYEFPEFGTVESADCNHFEVSSTKT